MSAIQSATSVGFPVITLGELRAGFRMGKQREVNERELRAFLQEPVVEVLDLDEEASAIYAELFADLRSAGTPVPTNDIWIAAVAVREGATVLTFDAHFEAIRRVRAQVLR